MPIIETPTPPQWIHFLESAQNGHTRKIDFSRLGEILQSLGDNAWVHDFTTSKTWYSSAFNPFIGYSNSEISARKADILWWQCIHPDDLFMVRQSDELYKNGKQDKHSLEYRIIDCKGQLRWVLDRGVVVERDHDGRPLVVAGTHIDVTTVKDLKNQLETSEKKKKSEIVDAVIKNLESDRKVIAEELHGNINQILAAARMMLEFMPVINEETGRYTEKVSQILYQAVDQVNKIFNDINPEVLDQVELEGLVKDLIQRLNKDRHFKIEFDLNGYTCSGKQNRDSELTIYRVIQDVLKRVFLNSKGSIVRLTLTCEMNQISLQIFTDDADLNIAAMASDLQVVNLINRCEHYGGFFVFEKLETVGTFFRAAVSA